MSELSQLNLPKANLKFKKEGNTDKVFDKIRKKYLVLTPEEWVRQHFLHFMIDYLKYPRSLIKVEGGHLYQTSQKRTDILLYERSGTPFLLVECKATTIKMDQHVIDQASLYNQTIKAPYIVVTNGLKHAIIHINFENNSYQQLEKYPLFPKA